MISLLTSLMLKFVRYDQSVNQSYAEVWFHAETSKADHGNEIRQKINYEEGNSNKGDFYGSTKKTHKKTHTYAAIQSNKLQ